MICFQMSVLVCIFGAKYCIIKQNIGDFDD